MFAQRFSPVNDSRESMSFSKIEPAIVQALVPFELFLIHSFFLNLNKNLLSMQDILFLIHIFQRKLVGFGNGDLFKYYISLNLFYNFLYFFDKI